MIRSNQNNGFTLIEALLALFIMAVVLVPIFVTQGTILQTVARRSNSIERIIYAKTFLLDARRAAKDARQFTLEKTVPFPPTKLTYTLKEMPAESPFKKIGMLLHEQVTMQWQEGNKQFTDALVTVRYKSKSAQT